MAGGVPEGHFDFLVAHLHYFREEFDAHGGFLAFVEFVADVAGSDVGLARARGPDYHNFEDLVVVVRINIINLLVLFNKWRISKRRLIDLISCWHE